MKLVPLEARTGPTACAADEVRELNAEIAGLIAKRDRLMLFREEPLPFVDLGEMAKSTLRKLPAPRRSYSCFTKGRMVIYDTTRPDRRLGWAGPVQQVGEGARPALPAPSQAIAAAYTRVD